MLRPVPPARPMPGRGRRPHSGVIATGEVLSFHRHCRRHREAKKTLARQGTWTVPPEVSQIAHQRLQFDMDKIQGMVKQQRHERQKSPKSRIQVVYSIFRDPTTRATSCGMGSQCGLIYTSNVGKELKWRAPGTNTRLQKKLGLRYCWDAEAKGQMPQPRHVKKR